MHKQIAKAIVGLTQGSNGVNQDLRGVQPNPMMPQGPSYSTTTLTKQRRIQTNT